MEEARAIFHNFGHYNHCNQPTHEMLWVAKRAGCASADHYLRKVMKQLHTVSGWCGDEDNGEMGSWYVLSALGLYSLAAGRDEMVLGSPEVVEAAIRLPGGKSLQIRTQNQGKENTQVSR